MCWNFMHSMAHIESRVRQNRDLKPFLGESVWAWIILEPQGTHGNLWRGVLWDFREFFGIPWNFVEFRGISWNFVEFRGILWNFVEFRWISWNFVGFRGSSWFLFLGRTFLCEKAVLSTKISWNFVGFFFANLALFRSEKGFFSTKNVRGISWNFVEFRGISWNFVGFRGISWDFVFDLKTPNCVGLTPKSSKFQV